MGTSLGSKNILASICFSTHIFISNFAFSDIQDIQVSDVTSRAFSVVLASDEPIEQISIRLFEDNGGAVEISDVLSTVISGDVPGAHENGIGKIDVFSLVPETNVYFQVEVQSSSGVSLYPDGAPYPEVVTAMIPRVSEEDGATPIVNPLLTHSIVHPDGVSMPQGTMYLVNIPGFSYSPISSFVFDSDSSSLEGLADFTNFYSQGGERSQIPEAQVITITEYKGRVLCPGLVGHTITRYRYSPNMSAESTYSLVEQAELCADYDLNCDGQINIEDVQRVSSLLGSVQGECEFDDEFDLFMDGAIDALDEQVVSDAIEN